MAKTEASLLNEEDLAVLDSTVFPLDARPDLVRGGPDGRLLISEKGRQFYTAAFRRAGIVVNLAEIRTRKDLHAKVMAASAALCAEADAGMRVELDAGRIPIQRREMVRVYLDGSAADFMAAAGRLEVCAAAGENVIPIGFRNRGTKGRSTS
jgi:hypothetical protein